MSIVPSASQVSSEFDQILLNRDFGSIISVDEIAAELNEIFGLISLSRQIQSNIDRHVSADQMEFIGGGIYRIL